MLPRVNATKILVKEVEKKEAVRKSGIIMPNQVRNEPSTLSIAVIVGSGTPTSPMTVNVGDKILHSPHAVVKVIIPEREETKDLGLEGEYGQIDLKDCLLVF